MHQLDLLPAYLYTIKCNNQNGEMIQLSNRAGVTPAQLFAFTAITKATMFAAT
jgi:hypothetical protein